MMTHPVRHQDVAGHDDPIFARDSSTRDAWPWNPQILLERTQGDRALARDLLELVVETVPGWLDQLPAAADRQDWITLRRLAHSLKSSGDNLGAEEPRQAAAALEQAAMAQDSHEVRTQLPRCVSQWTNLVLRADEALHPAAPKNAPPVSEPQPTDESRPKHLSGRFFQPAALPSGLGAHALAHLSHELRTPMTAILGFTESLIEDRDEQAPRAERRESLKIIRRNADYLLQLINNLLDLSKIEAGRCDLELVPMSLPKLLSDVRTTLLIRAQEKQLRLVMRAMTPVPETIHSDPLRLQQILMNLVGNAIKFTDHGQVTIEVSCLEAQTPEPQLQIDIVDTGLGMTEEQLSRLFRPFVQAEAGTTRRFGGTGLGLTISLHLARLLGGDIQVSSRPENGSRFRVTVRTGSLKDVTLVQNLEPMSERTGVLRRPRISLLGHRILLAEDQADNRLLICRFLTDQGAEVVTVENGADAVRLALSSEADNNPFTAILMDMNMPVLDGLAATRQLRASQYRRPVIALTAAVYGGQREICLAAGCDDFATKPIQRDHLVETLQKWMQER